MKKNEVINAIKEKTGFAKNDVALVYDAVFEIIADAMKKNDSVSVQGFGKFSAKTCNARDMRNPLTGETIHVEEHLAPKFSASSVLKDALKEA